MEATHSDDAAADDDDADNNDDGGDAVASAEIASWRGFGAGEGAV